MKSSLIKIQHQVAEQMITARLERKLSQGELAKKAGTGQAVISRIENMNANPTVPLLRKIAHALDIKFHLTIG